jgi:hypothetical protein
VCQSEVFELGHKALGLSKTGSGEFPQVIVARAARTGLGMPDQRDHLNGRWFGTRKLLRMTWSW